MASPRRRKTFAEPGAVCGTPGVSSHCPMTFLIADSFTDSLVRLTGDEQKAAKTTAFDLPMDPSAPGSSFHKLDRAKDKRFWSVFDAVISRKSMTPNVTSCMSPVPGHATPCG